MNAGSGTAELIQAIFSNDIELTPCISQEAARVRSHQYKKRYEEQQRKINIQRLLL